MSITEEPYYLKRDCSPMCDHQMECARCGSPKCIKSMHHSRLYGYTCNCGSQEWKPVLEFVGLQNETSCKNCGHSKSRHQTPGGFCKHCPCNEFVESTMPPIRL